MSNTTEAASKLNVISVDLRIFSDLVLQNIHNISKGPIPMSNEMELIKNYLKPEKLRFKEALNYENSPFDYR